MNWAQTKTFIAIAADEVHAFITGGIADYAELAGLIIVTWTFFKVRKVSSEVIVALREIRRIEAIADFSSLIPKLEEIKALYLESKWDLLPQKCSEVRKMLIQVKEKSDLLDANDKTAIQKAVTHLSSLESSAIDSTINGARPDKVRATRTTSQRIDDLITVLEKLRQKRGA